MGAAQTIACTTMPSDAAFFLDGDGFVRHELSGQHAASLKPDGLLLPDQPRDLLAHWACVQSDRDQLRHRGASGEESARRCGVLDVLAMGRRSSVSSVRRYAKGGKVQKTLAEWSSEV